MKHTIVLFLSILIFTTCDRARCVNYIILNSTDGIIKVIIEERFKENVFDTQFISPMNKMNLYTDSGISASIAGVDTIDMFRSLQIFNSMGSKYNKDPLNIKSWQLYSKRDEDTAELDIKAEDFK